MNNDKRRKEVAIGKVAVHSCLTLIIKKLKISVKHDRVNNTKYNETLNIIFSVVTVCGVDGRTLSVGFHPFGFGWINLSLESEDPK